MKRLRSVHLKAVSIKELNDCLEESDKRFHFIRNRIKNGKEENKIPALFI